MRRPIMTGNWKMFNTISEAEALVNELKELVADANGTEVVVCPTYVCLTKVNDCIAGSNIALGAQNAYFEETGAYTGEISVDMLASAGVQYVILGHSERRALFDETDEMINKKLRKVLSKNLTPILCVGEVLEEREKGVTHDVVCAQLEGALAGLGVEDVARIVIAYEPVWAIGTGKTATPDQAQEVHALIREELTKKYNRQVAQQIRIQYGGSVKPSNVDELMRQPDIDGALVGGASLKAADFARIVKFEA